MTKYGIGTKEVRKCYDGKMHECTILDCSVILSGKTFENKETIKKDGFVWWNDEKFWHKHATTEEETNMLAEKYKNLGCNVQIKPNFRITDPNFNVVD